MGSCTVKSFSPLSWSVSASPDESVGVVQSCQTRGFYFEGARRLVLQRSQRILDFYRLVIFLQGFLEKLDSETDRKWISPQELNSPEMRTWIPSYSCELGFCRDLDRLQAERSCRTPDFCSSQELNLHHLPVGCRRKPDFCKMHGRCCVQGFWEMWGCWAEQVNTSEEYCPENTTQTLSSHKSAAGPGSGGGREPRLWSKMRGRWGISGGGTPQSGSIQSSNMFVKRKDNVSINTSWTPEWSLKVFHLR